LNANLIGDGHGDANRKAANRCAVGSKAIARDVKEIAGEETYVAISVGIAVLIPTGHATASWRVIVGLESHVGWQGIGDEDAGCDGEVGVGDIKSVYDQFALVHRVGFAGFGEL